MSVAADTPATLIAALASNAAAHGRTIAVRERDLGIWQEYSWAAFFDDVMAAAAGLEALGLKPRAAMTVIGDNRYNLYVAMLGAVALGAFPSPVFPDVPPQELTHYTRHGTPDIAIAEDQEQVDKLIELRGRIGRPAHIIYDDRRGLGEYTDEGLVSFADVLARGRARLAAEPGLKAEIAGRTTGDDIAVLLHSSGTTGAPKGIAPRHRHVIAAVRNAAEGGYFQTGEEHYAYLPTAWIGDFVFTVCAGIMLRFHINIPERQETVLTDLRQVAPTFYLAAPRAWDNMLTHVQVGMADSTPFKRRLFDYFMPLAVARERRRLAGEPDTLRDRVLGLLGEVLVFAPIKDSLGLSRTRRAYTGGEALGEDTFLFFRALGINLKQFYGQTETSAFTAAQDDGAVRLHTVGRPLPGVDVKIDDSGEILVRSQSIVDGYFDDPDASAKAFVDGWLRTGDAGSIEADGQLVVLGRVGEVVRTAAGERYIPNYIENRLKFSPYIRNVAVIGAGLPVLNAIVCIDFDAVAYWAEQRGIASTSYADLSQKPEVLDLVRDVIARSNENFAPALRIHRFVNLHKDFDADDGEITRTRKLRRNVIEERYAPLIAGLYDGSTQVNFDARITYESGETGTMRRTLSIVEVSDSSPRSGEVPRRGGGETT
ncbi:MAG TPA: AMP-binding protein [Vineibacter sp.]|nr:AMP-binding protein [Vineibacter sp.]